MDDEYGRNSMPIHLFVRRRQSLDQVLARQFVIKFHLTGEKSDWLRDGIVRPCIPHYPDDDESCLSFCGQLLAYLYLQYHAKGNRLSGNTHVFRGLGGRTDRLSSDRVANVLADLTFEAVGVAAKGIAWRSSTTTRLRRKGFSKAHVQALGGWKESDTMELRYKQSVPMSKKRMQSLATPSRKRVSAAPAAALLTSDEDSSFSPFDDSSGTSYSLSSTESSFLDDDSDDPDYSS
jgi:hypothetical protein